MGILIYTNLISVFSIQYYFRLVLKYCLLLRFFSTYNDRFPVSLDFLIYLFDLIPVSVDLGAKVLSDQVQFEI